MDECSFIRQRRIYPGRLDTHRVWLHVPLFGHVSATAPRQGQRIVTILRISRYMRAYSLQILITFGSMCHCWGMASATGPRQGQRSVRFLASSSFHAYSHRNSDANFLRSQSGPTVRLQRATRALSHLN